MFGVDSGELLLIVLVAVVVIGPKDLPRVMRTVGQWVARARGMANQFRMGVDEMVRDTEIADLEKKWREQNEAIMRAHPITPDMAAPAPASPPAPDGWGTGLAPVFGDATMMQPLRRAAPTPPVGSLPARPTRPRLDKDDAAPATTVFPPDSGPPRAPVLAKAPPPALSGRRPPRTAPQTERP